MELKIRHANVNDDRRPDKIYKGIYPELRFPERVASVVDWVTDGSPDVISLCEMSQAAVDLIVPRLTARGYACAVAAYCPDAGAFRFVIAAREGLEATLITQIYLTKTGYPMNETLRRIMSREAIFEHNCFTEYEKSVPAYLISEKDGRDLAIVAQLHVSLTRDHRVESSKIVSGALRAIAKGTGLKVILTGDFNCFDPSDPFPNYLSEQIYHLRANWSSLAHMPPGVKSTFRAYPFDVLRFMSPEQKERESELLRRFREEGGSEDVRLEIRELHAQVARETVVPPARIGIPGLIEHDRSTNPLDGPILDLAVIYSEDGFEVPPRVSIHPSLGRSDHDAVDVSLNL